MNLFFDLCASKRFYDCDSWVKQGEPSMRRLLAVLLTVVAILAAGWLALRRPDVPFTTLEAAYANAQSEFLIGAEGRRIHYRDQGNPDGPVLVMVHGFSASLHTWEPWVRELDPTYRILTLDLPGHGLTRGFPLEEIDVEGFMAAVRAVTARAGVDEFTLIGSSMGGYTAWNYALTYPGDLDGLVLVGASGWPASREEASEQPLIFKLLENPLARTLLRDLDMTSMIRDGLEDSFVDTSLVTEEMVQRYATLARAPGHREALLHIITDQEDRVVATPEKLERIEVPTLVLHGREDRLVPVSGGKAFAQAIPGAELTVYEAVGHLPQEEIARRSARDLAAFLERRVLADTREVAGESEPAGSN